MTQLLSHLPYGTIGYGTFHPTQVNTPALTPAILAGIPDLPTPEGWKAELT